MEVNCEGCAGCCMDWRPLLAEAGNDESANKRRAEPLRDDATRAPLDGDTNFVPLTRDEVRAFLEAEMADALTPRFWRAADEHEAVAIDGYEVASVADRPVFFVGLRKPPKPVAPFDLEDESWLPACVFLDPTTLQCRIHDSDLLPDECSAYPAHNIALEQETECERVEAAFGGDRLVDNSVPEDLDGLLLGSQALGEKLFCHPRPERLEASSNARRAGILRGRIVRSVSPSPRLERRHGRDFRLSLRVGQRTGARGERFVGHGRTRGVGVAPRGCRRRSVSGHRRCRRNCSRRTRNAGLGCLEEYSSH